MKLMQRSLIRCKFRQFPLNNHGSRGYHIEKTVLPAFVIAYSKEPTCFDTGPVFQIKIQQLHNRETTREIVAD